MPRILRYYCSDRYCWLLGGFKIKSLPDNITYNSRDFSGLIGLGYWSFVIDGSKEP
jgi:hypothetical protein